MVAKRKTLPARFLYRVALKKQSRCFRCAQLFTSSIISDAWGRLPGMTARRTFQFRRLSQMFGRDRQASNAVPPNNDSPYPAGKLALPIASNYLLLFSCFCIRLLFQESRWFFLWIFRGRSCGFSLRLGFAPITPTAYRRVPFHGRSHAKCVTRHTFPSLCKLVFLFVFYSGCRGRLASMTSILVRLFLPGLLSTHVVSEKTPSNQLLIDPFENKTEQHWRPPFFGHGTRNWIQVLAEC